MTTRKKSVTIAAGMTLGVVGSLLLIVLAFLPAFQLSGFVLFLGLGIAVGLVAKGPYPYAIASLVTIPVIVVGGVLLAVGGSNLAAGVGRSWLFTVPLIVLAASFGVWCGARLAHDPMRT